MPATVVLTSDDPFIGPSNRCLLRRTIVEGRPFNFITAYLPQKALDVIEFDDVLKDLGFLLSMVNAGESIVLSIDANTSLGQPCNEIELQILGDILNPIRDDRGQSLLNLLK